MATERVTQRTLAIKFLGETKVFVSDFTDKLLGSDTISSIDTVTITKQNRVSGSSDLTIDSQTNDTTQVQVTVSSGTINEYYLSQVFVNTTAGELLEVRGIIGVV